MLLTGITYKLELFLALFANVTTLYPATGTGEN